MYNRKISSNTSFRQGDGSFNALEFADYIVKAYEARVRTPGHKQKNSFAPGGVGYGSGKCPRYWFLAFTGVEFEDNTDAMGIANMENGSYVHERLQDLFSELDLEVEHETEVRNEYPPILGFADSIITWKGERVICEFKSAKDEVYSVRKTSMQPLPYHKLQLLIYMKVLGISEGFLYYENKNTQEFLVIPVYMTEKNDELVQGVMKWMEGVYDNWKEGKLPERPFKKSTSECKYCPVRKACWSGEDGEIFIEPLVVPK